MKRVIIRTDYESDDRPIDEILQDKFTPVDEITNNAFRRYFQVSKEEAARLIKKADQKLIDRVVKEVYNPPRKEFRLADDLRVEKRGNKWAVVDSNGTVYRTCDTKRECVDRINNQTV